MLKFSLVFLGIVLLFFIAIFIYNKLTAKYVSPYTLEIYFGRKGCGKSTMLQKLATKYHKIGWNVYADEDTCSLPFVHIIDASKLWEYEYSPNSVILIDEVNLKWDNRDFKSFPKPLQRFLRLQRHYRCKIVMFSQTYDCDAKIRNLADTLYVQNKLLRVFAIARPYVKTPVVLTSLETRTEGRISDDFKPLKWWRSQVAFIPHWVKTFDSFKT